MKAPQLTPLFLITLASLATSLPVAAQSFSFSTGLPDGKMGTATRPSGQGKTEIEAADDFIVPSLTSLTGGTFTGLIPLGLSASDIGNVRVEIYRVFPKDSQDPPSGNVPTRVNSPSDVAFSERDAASGHLTFTTSLLSTNFTVANSVVNGINKFPNQTTGGEGAVTGQEIQFNVSFTQPFVLPADHYFFVPQVELTNTNGDFLWLSAPKPIVAPGTPFLPDLQSWIRNENLAPDWLRVGTDIVGAGAFNASFSLNSAAVPEPSLFAFAAGGGLTGLLMLRKRKRTL